MASTLMSINYDSNSDSADDLDFEPESDLSQDSDFESDLDKSVEDDEQRDLAEDAAAASQPPAETVTANVTTTPISENLQASVSAPSLTAAPVQPVDTPEPKKRGKGRPRKVVDPNDKSATTKATKPRAKKASTTKRGENSAAPKGKKGSKAEVSQKKKQPTTVESHSTMTTHGLLPLQSSQARIDMDHPLETFRWPFSAFSPEFLQQHHARDKIARDLKQAVEEMVGANTNASWRLQELDERVETSRQELRMTLDEISFRKSQLRDMSRMAVEMVKKLSSRRDVYPHQHQGQEQHQQQEQQQQMQHSELPSQRQVPRRPSLPEMGYDHPMDADRMDIDPPIAPPASVPSSFTQEDDKFVSPYATARVTGVVLAVKDIQDGAQSRDSIDTDMADPSSLHLAEPSMAEVANSSLVQPGQAPPSRKDMDEHLSGLNEYNIRSFLERIHQIELERRERW